MRCKSFGRFVLTALTLAVIPFLLGFDIDRATPGVYRIDVTKANGGAGGSGFLVSGHRLVVTNNHVVEGDDVQRVVIAFLEYGRPSVVGARIVATSPGQDLALLEAERDLPGTAFTLGTYVPAPGLDVVAIGYPGAADFPTLDRDQQGNTRFRDAFFTPTVTRGVVSRFIEQSTFNSGAAVVQHTAPTNHGNSGGPMFDDCNNVIGVTTFGPAASEQSQGILFSVHAREVEAFARRYAPSVATTMIACRAVSAREASQQMVGATLIITAMLSIMAVVIYRIYRRKPQVAGATHSFVRERVESALAKQASPAAAKAGGASGPGGAGPGGGVLRLVPLAGGAALTVDTAARGTVRIGRGSDADLIIDRDTISKIHIAISRDASDRAWVEDRNSTNGTFLDGKRITRAELKPGGKLRLGDVELLVQ